MAKNLKEISTTEESKYMVDLIQICLVCNAYAYKGANQAAQAVLLPWLECLPLCLKNSNCYCSI